MKPGHRTYPVASTLRTSAPSWSERVPGWAIRAIRPPEMRTSAINGCTYSSPEMTVGDIKRISELDWTRDIVLLLSACCWYYVGIYVVAVKVAGIAHVLYWQDTERVGGSKLSKKS